MRMLNKIIDRCIIALAGAAAVLMFIMMLAVCFAMASRYLFNKPFAFIIDYTAYSLVYITFLGAPWLLKLRKHISVDVLVETLPPSVSRWWKVALDLLAMCISAVVFYYSASLTINFYVRGVVAIDFLTTPRWLLIVSIPVGCFFLTIQALRNAMEGIYGPVKGGGGK